MTTLKANLAEIASALEQPRDAWRIATLASINLDGLPQARQVVIREVSPDLSSMTIFTDRRSNKVAELTHQPQCSLLFWCPIRQQQLRCVCVASFEDNIKSYWENVAGRKGVLDYATEMPPGSLLEGQISFDMSRAKENFCVIKLHVKSIDRLELSREGHRRQRLSADGVEDIYP